MTKPSRVDVLKSIGLRLYTIWQGYLYDWRVVLTVTTVLLAYPVYMWIQYRRKSAEISRKHLKKIREELSTSYDALEQQLVSRMKDSTQALLTRYNLTDGEEDTAGDTTKDRVLSTTSASYLYQSGKSHQERGDDQEALECFLAILYGVGKSPNTTNFQELPDCIHRVGELYFKFGRTEEAIKFMQAEKFVYENALIHFNNTQQVQQGKLGKGVLPSLQTLLQKGKYKPTQRPHKKGTTPTEGGDSSGADTADSDSGSLSRRDQFVKRMDTFTSLAQVYLGVKNYVMALNYAIKAMNMRKKLATEGENLEETEQQQVLLDAYVALSEYQTQQQAEERINKLKEVINKQTEAALGGLVDAQHRQSLLQAHQQQPHGIPTPSPFSSSPPLPFPSPAGVSLLSHTKSSLDPLAALRHHQQQIQLAQLQQQPFVGGGRSRTPPPTSTKGGPSRGRDAAVPVVARRARSLSREKVVAQQDFPDMKMRKRRRSANRKVRFKENEIFEFESRSVVSQNSPEYASSGDASN